MNAADVALLSVIVLLFGLISRKLSGTPISAPMLFVVIGLAIGDFGLGLLELDLGEGALHVLAELTLILVLFGDATRIDLRVLRRELGIPVRLLGLGLPLSIAVGGLLGKLTFPQLSWFEAATLGAVLAPTDAALGQAVVSSPVVPLRMRQALNVESGLNDGIALPFVLVFASLASMGHGETRTAGGWAQFAALQVTLGPICGAAIAWAGGAVIRAAEKRGYIEGVALRLCGIALASLCYAGAELAGGNGFIGAFIGGVTLGNTQRRHAQSMVHFLEAEGELFMLFVFLGMGASLVSPAFSSASLPIFLYVGLSLTVVRMAPVSVALIGSGVRAPSHLFLGWFGPRGLASILYGIVLLAEASLPHEQLVFNVIIATCTASVLLHGLTASAGAKLYGRFANDPAACPQEHAEASQHLVRDARSR